MERGRDEADGLIEKFNSLTSNLKDQKMCVSYALRYFSEVFFKIIKTVNLKAWDYVKGIKSAWIYLLSVL